MFFPPTPPARGFTLVELMIVVAIIGILAAIATPSFVTYMHRAKVAEAPIIMSSISDGTRSYYSSNQRYSTANGVEPWHESSAERGERPGLPVASMNKTFPGGDGYGLRTHDELPPRGGMRLPALEAYQGDESHARQVARALNLQLSGPTFFAYTYETEGVGPDATATIRACHSFRGNADIDGCGDGELHTVIQHCDVQSSSAPRCGPMYTTHEFR